ncbi:MAG: MarR family transcriptional regulator [Actinomycetota bacterium]
MSPAAGPRPAADRPSPTASAPEPGALPTSADVEWLDDEERRAWLALLEVGTGLFEILDRDLKRLGEVTMEDYEVLHLLSETEDRRLRVGELATRMLASRTRLSQRIDRLAGRGLVRRERCRDDGRAIDVILTEDGVELLERIAPAHLRSVRALLFDHLTRTDVSSLGRSLDKVVRGLRQQR